MASDLDFIFYLLFIWMITVISGKAKEKSGNELYERLL